MKEYILRVNYQETMSYFDSHKLPELIRCKYCKHWNPKNYVCDNANSSMYGRTCFYDWYCADAEKEEGVTDGSR